MPHFFGTIISNTIIILYIYIYIYIYICIYVYKDVPPYLLIQYPLFTAAKNNEKEINGS
jgi:hypothetical protein